MLYKTFYSSTGFAKFFWLNLSDHLLWCVWFSDKSWSLQRGWEAHRDTEAETCGSPVHTCPREK